MSNIFPFGRDLRKVRDWIGRYDCPSNTWHIQYLGGAASLDDCEFHFIFHGMDNLVTAHVVLSGGGLGLPIGPGGKVSIPRKASDLRDLLHGEVVEDSHQQMKRKELRSDLSLPFLDSISEPSVWNSCFNLTAEKQYLTRFSDVPFSLKDMDGASSSVEVVGASAIFVQWETISFVLPKSEGDKFPPVEMGSASRGFALPGTSVGKYSCRWKVLEWKDNFYARCPYRKGGENSIFTSNRFLLHLPPYSGYLFWTRDEYLKFFPDRSYPFWQDLFPQINESLEHFMDNEWAGSVGGWVGDVPDSYIEEFGSGAQ